MLREEPARPPSRLRAAVTSPYLLLAAAVLFWAGNFAVGRAIRGDVSPVALSFWRWALAVLLVLPFSLSLLRQHRAQLRAEWKLIVTLGAVGVTGFQVFSYQGLTMTTAINGTLLNTMTPVVIVILAWLLFRDRLTRQQALGVLVSLLGVVVVIARGDLAQLATFRLNPGDLWMLAAVGLWSAYSVLLKRRPATLPLFALSVATMMAGLLLLLPLYLWELARGGQMVLNGPNLLALLYVGIFPSAVALNFWNRGVAAVGPNTAGMFLYLMPVFGAILAVLFLGERLALYHLVGAALVFGGIALTTRPSFGSDRTEKVVPQTTP